MSLFSINKEIPFSKKSLSLVAVGISALALTACSTRSTTMPQERLVMVNGVPSYYIVKSGDTLSRISSRYGLDYRRVAALNGLDSDYKIYVGQKLRLINTNTATTNTTYNRPTSNTRPTYQPTPVTQVATFTQKNWLRPVSGNVTKTFDGLAGIKGQWYSASLGSPVVASQSGTVLYAGNQLAEYGNLIMIRHNNDFVSAYAHLGQFMVKEGQNVTAGQQIGTVGTVNGQPALEFQIRYRGTPVNPVAYLR